MRKQIIILFIIIVSLSGIASCENDLNYLDTGTENNKTDSKFEYTPSDDRPLAYNVISGGCMQYYDGCIYFYNGSGDVHNYNSSALMRYNTTTGNLTSVCGDPLCPHNTPKCPIYGITNNFISTAINFLLTCIQLWIVGKQCIFQFGGIFEPGSL